MPSYEQVLNVYLTLYLIDDTNKWIAKNNAVEKETVLCCVWPTCKLVESVFFLKKETYRFFFHLEVLLNKNSSIPLLFVIKINKFNLDWNAIMYKFQINCNGMFHVQATPNI